MQYTTLFRQWRFPLFVMMLLSAVFVHCFVNRAVVELEINVSKTTWFKIYWAEKGQPYSEKNMSRVRVRPGQEHYSFFLTDLRKIESLRIDPHQYEGEAVIKQLFIRQRGFRAISFAGAGAKGFSQLEPIFQVGRCAMQTEGFAVDSTGRDPQFRYLVQLQKSSPHYLQTVISVLVIFLLVAAFFLLTENYRQETFYIPLLFAAIFSLVLVMATVSGSNVHPDEYVHQGATQYYVDNWLPPAADAPAIRDTYSVYGVSRLNNFEAAYFFLGKFSRLLEPFNMSDYLRMRLFNVLLCAIILFSLLKYSELHVLAVPLLLTPQVWYVFSYCDSDAFSVFISFIISWQVVLPRSMFNRWLSGENRNWPLLKIALFATGCAMLFLLKKNYYFFIVFLAGYIVWKCVAHRQGIDLKTVYRNLALIVVLGLCLAGVRVGMSNYVNGFERTAKMTDLREELADPMYKPSTPLEKKHPFLYRKARGESLKELIKIDRWFEKTFRSAFGVYGYFSVSASNMYYNVIRWLGIALLLYCALFVLMRGGVAGNVLLFYSLGCASALIGASLYHSWTADFQSQGRYLFPILPMLGIVLYHIRPLLPSPGYRLLTLSMYSLSVYSFVFVGLLNIGKV